MADKEQNPVGQKQETEISDSEDVEVVEEIATKHDEEAGASSSWGGWFSSTISSAKAKSNEMFEYLKQDFNEFSETVQEAGRDLKEKLKLEDTAKSVGEVVGSKMNTVLEQVSTIFGVAPDDDDEGISYIVGSGGPVVISRLQAKIYSLALEERVFLEDPEDLKAYDDWTSTFDLETKNEELADLLTGNPHLQLHYSQLVPLKVSHLLFWHRFYYQVHLIFKSEEQTIPTDTSKANAGQSEAESDNSGHGEQALLADIVNISEEDQRRLLSEYEEEMKKGEGSGHHSRQSSETHMSSSSSGSFAFVTHDSLDSKME